MLKFNDSTRTSMKENVVVAPSETQGAKEESKHKVHIEEVYLDA